MRALLLAALLAVTGNASAAVYKCTNADGHIFYLDHTCDAGTKAASFNASAISGASVKAAKPAPQRKPSQNQYLMR